MIWWFLTHINGSHLNFSICNIYLTPLTIKLLLPLASRASQVALAVKNPSANAEDLRNKGLIPGSGRFPWRRAWQPTSSLAWIIPWTEEPGWVQSMGSQRVGHDWSDWACMHAPLASNFYKCRFYQPQTQLLPKTFKLSLAPYQSPSTGHVLPFQYTVLDPLSQVPWHSLTDPWVSWFSPHQLSHVSWPH